MSTVNSFSGEQNYGQYLKPKLQKLLKAAGLDKNFVKAKSDYLYYLKETGEEQRVTDFLGGYGVSLFGHNNPRLIKEATNVFIEERPFVAQASIRSQSGNLAKKLSNMLEERVGTEYITTLANSGTEAVEATLKHVTLEQQLHIQQIFDELVSSFKALRLRQQGELNIPETFFVEAEEKLGVASITTINELEYHLLGYNQTILETEAKFIALKGAFHGKSSGALKLTFNKDFRVPWKTLGIQCTFIERNDIEVFQKAIEDSFQTYYGIEFSSAGEIQLVEKTWTPIVACFIEPIQGEGGIHELEYNFCQSLSKTCKDHDIPLVIDEIQSGMGRTGTFLASETLDIKGDYYLLSKALGGGLAKIAAMMVTKDRYIEDFGYLHTSTFAEDHFSSTIALTALEILEEDDSAMMQTCSKKGAYIKDKLDPLMHNYPTIFKEIRGRGLLLGLELHPQTNSKSNFLRMLSEQSLLAYLICGYLLNVHHIRLTPTLSSNLTIRIEPSAYIRYSEIDQLCFALEDVARCLVDTDSHALAHYLFKPASKDTSFRAELTEKEELPATSIKSAIDKEFQHKVACVGHFMEPQALVHWDPYLAPMTDAECNILLEKTQAVLEPFVVDEQYIQSLNGETLSVSIVGIPYTADQLIDLVRGGQAPKALELVSEAHVLAMKTGATQIGFTGYSSIATNNCTAIVEDRVGVTSGNSLTAALGLDALHIVMSEKKIGNDDACLGVVGGVGNIGRILAEIEAEVIPKIILIGREGSQRRLKRLAATIYYNAWQAIQNNLANQGIAKSLLETNIIQQIPNDLEQSKIGSFIYDNLNNEIAPIKISTSMDALKQCNIIITATNTPEPIIHAEHLGNHEIVICDISVPPDADDNISKNLNHVAVIKGGVVQLPLKQSISIKGMPLESGLLYACIAETVLLGLSGISENFSYGALETTKVKRIRKISKEHGFEVLVKNWSLDFDS